MTLSLTQVFFWCSPWFTTLPGFHLNSEPSWSSLYHRILSEPQTWTTTLPDPHLNSELSWSSFCHRSLFDPQTWSKTLTHLHTDSESSLYLRKLLWHFLWLWRLLTFWHWACLSLGSPLPRLIWYTNHLTFFFLLSLQKKARDLLIE